ncbi:hypothetical protein VNO77_29911 [Canavalia gladiata]|uniref:Uncharacterized protein n=1 Tax=Canavalia gladiata TaxID=3824 RepID=A0AAN9KMG8_CANGL
MDSVEQELLLFVFIFNYMLSFVSLILAGHVGSLDLALALRFSWWLQCKTFQWNLTLFQGLVIIPGLLPNPKVALDSISSCVRVSNGLGAAHPRVAKFSVFVVNGTSSLVSMVFYAIILIFQGWQLEVSGSYSGLCKLACYYIIDLTVGCVGFKTSLGVTGIWWRMILGVLAQTITLIIVTARTNWDAEVEKAIARIKRSAENETLDQLVAHV